MRSLFKLEVFKNVDELERFLDHYGFLTPTVERSLDRINKLFEGTSVSRKPRPVEKPVTNSKLTNSLIPTKVHYQEEKGVTTLIFGELGTKNIVKVKATLDSRDKFCRLTGFLVGMTKYLYSSKKAREIIDAAYVRYPRNPKAFLEGAVAAKLGLKESELKDLMESIVKTNIHVLKIKGLNHRMYVV